MHFLKNGSSVLAILILFSCCSPSTQKGENAAASASATGATDNTWKKLVTRDVDMNEVEDTVVHVLNDRSGDTVLFQMLLGAVKSGKVTAYNNIGALFSNKLSAEELKTITEPAVDTEVVTDPVTGGQNTTVIARDFKYREIHKYRILEEWTLDPATGKTSIRITGIAPLMDLYSENLSGVEHAIFWLKYEEASGVLKAYEQLHPDNTLASRIWANYFKSDIKPTVQK